MLARPNPKQAESIRNMAQNGNAFSGLLEWMQDNLNEIRQANDTLPLDEIQIGQGRAQVLNMEITILKELIKGSD